MADRKGEHQSSLVMLCTLHDFGPVMLLLWLSIPQLLNGVDKATGTIELGSSTEALQTFRARSFSVGGLSWAPGG